MNYRVALPLKILFELAWSINSPTIQTKLISQNLKMLIKNNAEKLLLGNAKKFEVFEKKMLKYDKWLMMPDHIEPIFHYYRSQSRANPLDCSNPQNSKNI